MKEVTVTSLNVPELAAGRWSEFADLVDQADVHRFFARKVQVGVVERVPFFLGQIEMLAKNGFGAFIVDGDTLCDRMKLGGIGKLRADQRAMNHERRACAGLAPFRSEVSDGGDGLDGTHVVKSEIDRQRFEKVVEADSIADETAVRFNQHVEMPNVFRRGGTDGFEEAPRGILIDFAGKNGIHVCSGCW